MALADWYSQGLGLVENLTALIVRCPSINAFHARRMPSITHPNHVGQIKLAQVTKNANPPIDGHLRAQTAQSDRR